MTKSTLKSCIILTTIAGSMFAVATPAYATQYWSTCFHGKYITPVFWSNSERRKIMETELTRLLPELAAAPYFNYPTCSMQESQAQAEDHRQVLMKNWGPTVTNVPLPFSPGPEPAKPAKTRN